MRRIELIGLAPLVVIVFVSCAPKQVRFATGGATGTYYAFGSAMAQILQEKTGIPIIVETSGASRANIQQVDKGENEMALVQNDVMDYAWRGVDLFANDGRIQSFLAMSAIYAEVCQVVVNPASGVRTIDDLRGKTVSVGDAGSGVEFSSRHILEAYGITFNDLSIQNLGVGPSADALRDNRIDAFFFTGGAPTPAVVDLAAGNNVMLLEVDNAHVATLSQRYPFYTTFSIPAGTYRGQTGAVQTVAVKATLVVKSSLPENTVYNLTKALFENRAQIAAAHVKGNEISAAYAVQGISVPFHPGAAKYFREIGALR